MWDGRGDRPQQGTVTITLTAVSNNTNTISFNPPFSSAPLVFLTIHGANVYITAYSGESTTGATVGVRRYDGLAVTASVDVAWRAVLT